MPLEMIPGYRCKRCGHTWVPRHNMDGTLRLGDEEPKVCPKCKSPYWAKPRKVKVEEITP